MVSAFKHLILLIFFLAFVIEAQAEACKPKTSCNDSFITNFIEEKREMYIGQPAALLGGIGLCSNRFGQITKVDVQKFDATSCIRTTRVLRDTDDFNGIAENFFFQDLAFRSHRQALCRIDFFYQTLSNPSKLQAFTEKAFKSFDAISTRLQELSLYRQHLRKELQEWEMAAAGDRGGMAGTRETRTNLSATIDQVSKEISGLLTKIPLGYEPEVKLALENMALQGKFDDAAYTQAMVKASDKYRKSDEYYRCESVPAGNNQITYCLDRDYKVQAGTSGQINQMVDNLSDVDNQFKLKLQCRLDAKYNTGPNRLTNVAAVGMLAGGLASLALRGGVVLAGAGASAVGIAVSGLEALAVVTSIEQVRQACFSKTYIISAENPTKDGKSCDPEAEYQKALKESDNTECAISAGLATAVVVPPFIKAMIPAKPMMAARVDALVTRQSVQTARRAGDPATFLKNRQSVIAARQNSAVSAARLGSGAASTTTSRKDQFVSENLYQDVTTPAQNRQYVELAKMDPPPAGTRFFDTDNSMMQKLNTATQDKNLVTSLTNKHKALMMDKVKFIQAKYPDVEVVVYSDFKSLRVAFRPKPPATKLPAEIESDMSRAFNEVNAQFAKSVEEIQFAKIIQGKPKAEEIPEPGRWFSAGWDETADTATNAGRLGRTAPGKNEMRRGTDAYIREANETNFKYAEAYRAKLEHTFKGRALMETVPGTTKMVPTAQVFDAIKKTKTPTELQTFIKNTTGQTISEYEAKLLRTYQNYTDTFSPSIYVVERQYAVLDNVHGGYTIDLIGAGSKNFEGTARGIARADDFEAAVKQTRIGEQQVTIGFRERTQEVQDTVMPIFKRNKIKVRFVASGDDMAIIPAKPIPDKVDQEIREALSKIKDPSSIRMSSVSSGIKQTSDRMILATQGEELVKIATQYANESVPLAVRGKIFSSAQMETTTLGSGNVKIRLSGEGVSPEIRRIYDDAFKRAVEKFNSTTKSNYRPAP